MFNSIKKAAQVAEEKAQLEIQAAIDSFKTARQTLIDEAVVDANGFLFDADEVSIGRMANALLATISESDSFLLKWSLADTDTGVMTEISLGDLRLAHQLAVQNMATVWSV